MKQLYASALEFHIEGLRMHGEELSEKVKGVYELVFKLDVHALLNYYNGTLRLNFAKVSISKGWYYSLQI